MPLALFLATVACAGRNTTPPDEPIAVETTVTPPAVEVEPSPYLPLGQALQQVEPGGSAEVCVTGEYQSSFERSVLVGATDEGPVACWAGIPVELSGSPVRGPMGFRAEVDACGKLERGQADARGPGRGGFGHLGQYPCQFTADKVDRQQDLAVPTP